MIQYKEAIIQNIEGPVNILIALLKTTLNNEIQQSKTAHTHTHITVSVVMMILNFIVFFSDK